MLHCGLVGSYLYWPASTSPSSSLSSSLLSFSFFRPLYIPFFTLYFLKSHLTCFLFFLLNPLPAFLSTLFHLSPYSSPSFFSFFLAPSIHLSIHFSLLSSFLFFHSFLANSFLFPSLLPFLSHLLTYCYYHYLSFTDSSFCVFKYVSILSVSFSTCESVLSHTAVCLHLFASIDFGYQWESSLF